MPSCDKIALLSGSRTSAALFSGLPLVAGSLMAVAFAWSLTKALVLIPNGLAAMIPWLFAIAVSAILRGIFDFVSLYLAARRACQIKNGLRRRVLSAIFNARAGSSRLIGENATAIVDDIEAIDGYIVRYSPAKTNSAIGPLIILLAAFGVSPIAAGLLLATLIPFVLLMALAGGAAAEASRRQLDALAKLSGLFADRVRALPLILAFQAEGRETARIRQASRDVSQRTLSVLQIAFVSSAALEFFAALSVALIAVYAGFSLLGLLPFKVPETLTFEHGFFVLALAPEFYAPMRRLAAAYHEKQIGEAATVRLCDTLDLPQTAVSRAVALASAPNVKFAAASANFADEPDFHIGPFDLDVPAGSVAALMGPTGSGKTTLLKLLIGEAQLASGDIFVDGQSLNLAGAFAPLISWAGQAPVLLPATIGENIALAWPAASPAEIAHVAAQVGLTAALAGRHGGLNAVIDERGSGLSGGERRRIGLARALLKPAPILILDEPTADLDSDSEDEIIEVLRASVKNRTVLIATHSERVAAIADRVVRL